MANYFNTLPLREQLAQLAKCRFMDMSEFADGVEALKGKKNGSNRLWCTRS
jgi:ketol-acid reductoisomerase